MKKISILFTLNLFFLFLLGCSSNDDTDSDTGVQVLQAQEILNVSYGGDSDQVYDIYLPANRTQETTKVFILVHGGSWVSGDKSSLNYAKDLLQTEFEDYAIVNINYRLGNGTSLPFDNQLDDISTIIADLKTKQSTYAISNQYAFIGFSAGAHLSMLWSYTRDQLNEVNMVGNIVGPTNFTDPAYLENAGSFFQFLSTTIGQDATNQLLEQYSPFHQVTSNSAPTIMFYGGMDSLIPNSQGIDMDNKLGMLNVTHEFTFYPEEGHGWEGNNFIDTWIKMSNFISTHH